MFVSGVVATASLVGILVALFGVGIGLSFWEKSMEKNREH